MKHVVVLIVFTVVCQAEANTYTTWIALKAAVDDCLSVSPFDGTNCNMNSWDVSQVTDMERLFYLKSKFNADISAWNTSSVKYMSHTFSGATSFNADISGWDISSVMYMSYMFSGATSCLLYTSPSPRD